MFYQLGIFAHRQRWSILLLWAAALAVSLVFAPRVSTVLHPGGFTNPNSQGNQGVRLLHQELGASRSTFTVVFASQRAPVEDPEFRREMERVLAPLRAHPKVTDIFTYASTANRRLISPDGRTTYTLVGLDASTAEAQRLLPALKALLPDTWLERWVTGGPAAYADMELVSHRDLQRAESFSLPVALLSLLLVFGGVLAAGMPVLVGGISVLVTLALVFFLGQVMEMSIFVQNIATMLGLGISIDYALLMVSRFREELPEHGVEEALARTMATAGRAVFFSGLTVFLGLSGLLVFDYMMLRSVGVGGALVVLVSLVAALTLLPAALSLLGPRINALTLGLARETAQEGGFWRRLAGAVARRPLPVFAAVLALLLALGLPFLRVRMGAPDVTILPRDVESRQGFDLLRERFGAGEIAPIFVVVEAQESILGRDSVGAVYDYARRLQALPGVARVESIVTLDPLLTKTQYQFLYARPEQITDPAVRRSLELLAGGRVALISVVTQYTPVSQEARALVREVRSLSPAPGLRTYVGGAAAELMDVVDDLYTVFPRALLIIVVITYLALLTQFRSPVLPAKAVLMDTLSILASYGAMVVIFQDGHLSGLLRFTPEGFVDATVPIIMFCVLFGLSMDYEVFMLSRIKEEYDACGDNGAAVAAGLERTGRIVTSAALIIVIVSGSFALADIVIIKALGVGMALAIFLDATVVRALLVPATMHLLGRWNWWSPHWLRGR
ncbi:MAG: MMPL family transporter [Chloroflexi bacterium]|nr:MMPL family transporter [Chloroflexota bacterium]